MINRITDEKDEALLSFIQGFVDINMYSPSIREIKDAVGMKSTSGIHARITKLEKLGLLHKIEGVPRSIHVTDKGQTFIGIQSLN